MLKKVITIRYSQIREMDISNGEGIGVSLFVQGCHFHCKNCFNPNTWNFDDGYEWNEEIQKTFIQLIDKPYIKRISILGGEPLADENVNDVLKLVTSIKQLYSNKKIWIYSGYTWEQIYYPIVTDNINLERDKILHKRKEIVSQSHMLIDGKYNDNLRDLTLKFRGSSNQRIIDVKQSLKHNQIILYQ